MQQTQNHNPEPSSGAVRKLNGWGATEYDDFQLPFQWVGKEAGLSIESTFPILFIYAGSPDFDGSREISVSAGDFVSVQPIKRGWHAYQFDLEPVLPNDASELTIELRVDKLIDVAGDTRDLGIMVRDVRLHRQVLSGIEVKLFDWNRRTALRVEHYSKPGAPGIVWLASYPRSGNTWMRFLLTNLLFERVERSDLIGEYIDEILDPLYDAREPRDRTIQAFQTTPAHIVKTHLEYSPSTMPLADKTVGAIYIVRNPLDITVSLGKWRQENPEQIMETFLKFGLYQEGLLRGFGSWHSHVFSWLNMARQRSVPVLLIRYEDLKSDTLGTCQKIMEWLQIARTADQLKEAVRASSLENLRAMEEKEVRERLPGIFFVLEGEKSGKKQKFLADGKSYNFREYLTEPEIQTGLSTFGALMEEFGYL
jgi:hypothetical protein